MESLTCPFGTFSLQRLPLRRKETLRAWDAADEYLLSHMAEQFSTHTPEQGLLIVNDTFGALAVAAAQYRPVLFSDSWLAQAALKKNLHANNTDASLVSFLPATETLDMPVVQAYMKLPKNTCLLEQQLIQIRKAVPEGTTLVAGDMAKHIHTSTLNLFEKHFGPTKTSLARKKARLIFATVDKSLDTESGFPRLIEHNSLKLVNHAGIFSRQKLDIGTRFFLEHLPHDLKNAEVIDLGCGNGALGIATAQANPEAQFHFVDESFMAVQSARESWQASGLDDRAQFTANNCLTGFHRNAADVVLCNPPFHQGNTVGDYIAWQMFKESADILKKGGELRIIGNRHLGYHTKLKKLFGNCRTVATNEKFVVLSAQKK